MDDQDRPSIPPPSAEHKRVAAGQFERANQVVAHAANGGRPDYNYAIRLLLSCCKLDPANLLYRQALRRTEKAKFNNNLRGSWVAWVFSSPTKARIKAVLRSGDYLKVLELGESVLIRNPWDVGVQMDMAQAAVELKLLDLAVWSLEQARQKAPMDAHVNRTLAKVLEKRGNYDQSRQLWELVKKANPADDEATGKLRDLAARETIERGQYEAKARGQAVKPPSGEGRVRPPSGEVDATVPAAPAAGTSRDHVALNARIQADPKNPNTYLQLAAANRRAGKIDQARALLEQGLAATNNSQELQIELADLALEPLRQEAAAAVRKNEAEPSAEAAATVERLRKDLNIRELEVYRKKAAHFPTDLTHRYEMGVRLLRAGQPDEAIKELQAARPDPRLHWKALLQLGHCFRARNNWRLASHNYEEARKHVPASEVNARKDLLYAMAHGYATASDLPRAVELGCELANLDYGYRDIAAVLDEWQTRLASRATR